MSQRIEATVSDKHVVVFFDICDGRLGQCFYCSKIGRLQHVNVRRIEEKGKEIADRDWIKIITIKIQQRLLHKRAVCLSSHCQSLYIKDKEGADRIIW
ncbi:MAG: hypothetical protein AAB587_00880 [Patescibacteria group bacterium]